MKQLLIGLTALAAIALSAPAQAQFAKAEDAIKYRQSAFTVMGTHFGRVGAMVQGKIPFDAKMAADNIVVAASVAKLPYAAFGEGTDFGANTKAKPEIWKEKTKFDAGAQKMQTEMAKLVEATKGGDFTLDQLKTAFGPVGQSCKECHDTYKAK
jgi:cytochrome c556